MTPYFVTATQSHTGHRRTIPFANVSHYNYAAPGPNRGDNPVLTMEVHMNNGATLTLRDADCANFETAYLGWLQAGSGAGDASQQVLLLMGLVEKLRKAARAATKLCRAWDLMVLPPYVDESEAVHAFRAELSDADLSVADVEQVLANWLLVGLEELRGDGEAPPPYTADDVMRGLIDHVKREHQRAE